jgi:hypothetical protein
MKEFIVTTYVIPGVSFTNGDFRDVTIGNSLRNTQTLPLLCPYSMCQLDPSPESSCEMVSAADPVMQKVPSSCVGRDHKFMAIPFAVALARTLPRPNSELRCNLLANVPARAGNLGPERLIWHGTKATRK